MQKTGQSFEMNPETFTLANVFAMELHRFQDSIAEIVTCATKELSIEKVSFSLQFFPNYIHSH
jgi:dynein heavy chain